MTQASVGKNARGAGQVKHEDIVVVKRDILFPDGAWSGFKPCALDAYEDIVREHGECKERSTVEDDPSYKQIIPYVVFEHNNLYFLMQRKDDASEARLREKFSLGIGGHVRKEDLAEPTVAAWAQREFHEEVAYNGTITFEHFGVLNDESTSVGRVHVGLVLLAHGTSDSIAIKSEHKHGMLASRAQCTLYVDRMEPWSSLVWHALMER